MSVTPRLSVPTSNAIVENTTTYSYLFANKVGSITASYTLDDNLVVYGDNTYLYDEDGYLKTKTTPDGTTTYSYGTMGELLSVITPTKNITYQHNANNQRVAKLVDGTVVEKYLWANLTTLLAVYDSSDTLVQRFEYADQRMPVSMTHGTDKFYLHYDQVGSLRAVTDSSHNIIKEVTYDTFGNVLSDSNEAFKVPFGFAGGLYDVDTKLTRFGYRDYDAETGKWTAKDPIGFSGGDSNLYGYVLGDPVNFVDPTGLILEYEIQWWKDFFQGSDDFLDNYQNMRDANTIDADKYFHCMANCQASNRGDGGWNAARFISEGRELTDEYFKGDAPESCNLDRAANETGRDGGNCKKTCSKYRPTALDSKW